MTEVDTELAFKQIKKQNGEAVAKVLRSAVLLDIPNLAHILEFAGKDPDKIKKLVPVIREIYKSRKSTKYQTRKSPLKLLSEAGYDAFVVKTEKEKNSIKKYYRSGEEICTFRDPRRHLDYYMIHAIKRGADKIQPSDYPEREDEYGTSVISIQIAKGGGFISIKNRYNHTVNDPDSTFNNNPDNIIPGLSTSLKNYFNVDFSVSKSSIPNNFRMVHDQLVYFNYEVNNTYFGPDYYFSGSTITKLNTSYEIMLDEFILNVKTGEVRNVAGSYKSTHKILQEIFQDKKITVRKNPNNKNEHVIYADDVHLLSAEKGIITELNLPNIKQIGDYFLFQNKNLRKLYAPELEYIGNDVIYNNRGLTELDLPNVREIETNFLGQNKNLAHFNAPKLEKIGYFVMQDNQGLTELDLPNIREIRGYSLMHNENLAHFNAPKLVTMGENVMQDNLGLTELNLPALQEVGADFLIENKNLSHFNAPKLKKVDDSFMYFNQGLTELNLPALQEVGPHFLSHNKKLKTLYAPNLKIPESQTAGFLRENTELTDLVVANGDALHKYHKRLALVLGKNRIKKNLKDGINNMINVVAGKENV